MAQSKVTDYYTRRKSSTLQPTKRSARNLKLSSSDITPAKTRSKRATNTVNLPQTLPVKTAAFGDGSLVNNVDLSSQLRSFNHSKSSPQTNIVSDILSRTFVKPTHDAKQAEGKAADNNGKTHFASESQRVLERTPIKRLASDPDKDGPPKRKRSKVVPEGKSDLRQDEVVTVRTPSRTKKSTAVKVRRRLDHEVEVSKNATEKSGTRARSSRKEKLSLETTTGGIDVSEMREKLAGCGKLADLQARLALVKGTAAEVKKLREKSVKIIKEKEKKAEEKPAAPSIVPAFERYRHLIQPGPSSLALPFKYRSLEDVFRCSDTVVSMLHNRIETCTFSKLKYGVQEMSRKTFDLSHLKQIKTVYPTAYDLNWTKTLPRLKKETEKKEPYTLLVEANLAGIPTDQEDQKDKKGTDVGPSNLTKGLSQPSSSHSGSAMFDKFTPSMLIARRTLFHNGLVDIVKSHHKDYLAKLNPPIPSIPDEKLHRWHPKFPLENIPAIEQADLPLPQKVATFDTAKDVLDKARQMMVNPKVTKALEMVAKNSELKAAVEAKRAEDAKKKTAQPPKKTNQALKGVSQDLLNRIKAKEAQKSALAMMRTPEEEGRIGMLERLPELCRILRVYFLAEKKAALPIDSVIQKLMDSYRSALSRDDVEKHINLMIEVLPDWLKKVHIRKDCYIKMDKTKELNSIINILNAKLRDAKRLE